MWVDFCFGIKMHFTMSIKPSFWIDLNWCNFNFDRFDAIKSVTFLLVNFVSQDRLIIFKNNDLIYWLTSSIFDLINLHRDDVRSTKCCFVIGWFTAEGGTTIVVMSDWTVPMSVNPLFASLRQVDGQNKREVKRRAGDGANSGTNHLQRGLFSVGWSHFLTHFTCLSYITAVSPLYGSIRVSLTTRTTVLRSLDQVSYLVLHESSFCLKLRELTLSDVFEPFLQLTFFTYT